MKEKNDEIEIKDASLKKWQVAIIVIVLLAGVCTAGYVAYSKYTACKDEQTTKKVYIKHVASLGAVNWVGFDEFEKLGMKKGKAKYGMSADYFGDTYNIKKELSDYVKDQKRPEMSRCEVKDVKKTDSGYSFTVTMYWSPSGYFTEYKATCEKNGKNVLCNFVRDQDTPNLESE